MSLELNLKQYLSAEQLQPVLEPDFPILVKAGPGSGKTRLLLAKAIWLLYEKKVDPNQVFLLSYTNKSAFELEERFNQLIAEWNLSQKKPFIGTIHSLAQHILDQEVNLVNSSLALEKEKEIFKKQIKVYKKESESEGVYNLFKHFTKEKKVPAKNKQVQIKTELLEQYWQWLDSLNSQDYSTLLYQALNKLEKEKMTNRERYLLVDEFQDVSEIQFALFKAFLGNDSKVKGTTRAGFNLLAIGDLNQAIFGFRGGQAQIMKELLIQYKNRTFTIKNNFRSSQEVVTLSNNLIRSQVLSSKKKGLKPLLINFKNPSEEARFIVREIRSLCGFKSDVSFQTDTGWTDKIIDQEYRNQLENHYEKYSYKDIAILVRNRSLASHLINEIDKEVIPFLKFDYSEELEYASLLILSLYLYYTFQEIEVDLQALKSVVKKEIDFTSLFKELDDLVKNIEDSEIDYRRFIRGVIDRILSHFKDEMDSGDNRYLIDLYLDSSIFNKFLKTVNRRGREKNRQKDVLKQLYLSIDSFIQVLNQGFGLEKYDKIRILTCHGAKGLEFPVVFVVGFEDKIFSSHKKEDRNLLYVSITRAERVLYLTRSNRRSSYSSKLIDTQKSGFYSAIKNGLKEFNSSEIIEYKQTRKKVLAKIQKKLF